MPDSLSDKKAGQLGNKGGPKSNDDSEEEVLKAMEQEGLKNYDFIDSEGYFSKAGCKKLTFHFISIASWTMKPCEM